MDTRDTRSLDPSIGREIHGGGDGRATGDGRDVRDIRTPSERAALRGERDERSIADLIKELRDESTALMRQELALAKTEMSEKASRAARNSAYVGVGAVLCYLGLFFALVAATVGLALLLGMANLGWHSWWLAPLLVGALIGIAGWIITKKGMNTLKHESLVPERTVQSLQEDKQWLQDKVTK
jgi:hypothetical protein